MNKSVNKQRAFLGGRGGKVKAVSVQNSFQKFKDTGKQVV